MLPGPTVVRACPQCGEPFLEHTLRSGNTFGARFWTDGWQEAPMMPDRPWLVKCRRCAVLFWIDEAKKMASIKPWSKSRKFADAGDVKTPTCSDYYRYLPQAQGEKEKYVRMRAWWASNSKRRKSAALKSPLTAREKKNLEAMFTLWGEAEPDETAIKAEIARELGRFEECLRLLQKIPSGNDNPFVKRMTELAKAGEACVAEVVLDG